MAEHRAQSKIGNLQSASDIKQEVLGLQVPMTNTLLVDVLLQLCLIRNAEAAIMGPTDYTRNELVEVVLCNLFVNSDFRC